MSNTRQLFGILFQHPLMEYFESKRSLRRRKSRVYSYVSPTAPVSQCMRRNPDQEQIVFWLDRYWMRVQGEPELQRCYTETDCETACQSFNWISVPIDWKPTRNANVTAIKPT
jgi:hypothetical protein